MQFGQARYYKAANRLAIDLIVIHTMQYPEKDTAAEWCCGFFKNPIGAGGKPAVASAHYAVDCDSVTQMVEEKDIAWHAGPVNNFSIGIEHAGMAQQTREQWLDAYSMSMLRLSAELVADICTRYDIPVRRLTAEDLARGERRGICGHVDVTKGLKSGSHWDPGPNFPWDTYLDMVRSFMIVSAEEGEMCSWVRIGDWEVAPVYIGGVSLGAARDLAAKHGCELPTPELVDEIWRASDLKIKPLLRKHDGTPKTMSSPEVLADQARRVVTEIGGRHFTLLGGAYKDVCVEDGKVGLYGWHVADGVTVGAATHPCTSPGPGRVVQPFYGGHSMAWCDYSQGLRLVRRAR